jgi:hypothetical protein
VTTALRLRPRQHAVADVDDGALGDSLLVG